jgi:hypothetical protein
MTWFRFERFAAIVWYSLGIYLALTYVQGPLVRAWHAAGDFSGWLGVAKSVLGLLILLAFFVLIHSAVRATAKDASLPAATAPAAAPSIGEPFPSQVTVIVGFWLLVLAGICVTGLFFALSPSSRPEWLARCLNNIPDLSNALVTAFGAGVGSEITTILGYLEHASEKKDFERAYAPWYVGRPLMGFLLGLVFYFLLRGGLLAVAPSTSAAKPEDLNPAALAGLGGLVGLFSKNAIEKLRELFNTLFSSRKSAEESVLERLPADLKKQIAPYLSDGEAAKKSS